MLVKATVAAAAVVFLASSAMAQIDKERAMSVCKSAFEEKSKDPNQEQKTIADLMELCAEVYVELNTTNAQTRKKLADRAGVVPPVVMETCMKGSNGDRSDGAVLLCLDITLSRAFGDDLKGLRYFEMVKNGNAVRRYWTPVECTYDLQPGAVCISK